MKIAQSRKSKNIKFVVAGGLIVIATSGLTAFNMLQNTSADETSPIQIKVQDHEARIQKNEKDIATTKDQVEQVEQKAEDASQTAAAAQQRVTVVERKVETQAAPIQKDLAPTPSASPPAAAILGECYSVDQYHQWEIDCQTHEIIREVIRDSSQ